MEEYCAVHTKPYSTIAPSFLVHVFSDFVVISVHKDDCAITHCTVITKLFLTRRIEIYSSST